MQITTRPARMRQWFLGVHSRQQPAQIMSEVYRALRALKFVWTQLTGERCLLMDHRNGRS